MSPNKDTDTHKLAHTMLEAMPLRTVEAVKVGMKGLTCPRPTYTAHRGTVFR